MTFKEIQDDALFRVRKAGDAPLYPRFRLWVNQGQRNVTRRFLWYFLKDEQGLTTSPSQASYRLDADTGVVYGVRDAGNRRALRFVTDMEFDRSYPDPEASSGTPLLYLMPGQARDAAADAPRPLLRLYPVPSAAAQLRVRHFRMPAAMVNDADVPEIPEDFHELLVHYACKTYFTSSGDPRAVTHEDEFENGLREMVERYGAVPADRVDRLRGEEERAGALGRPGVRMPSNYPA